MDIERFLATHRLPQSYAVTAQKWFNPLCERISAHQSCAKAPILVGINGSQGSGKSTLSHYIEAYLAETFSKKVVCLSIDDFYFSRAHRQALSETVHPLFVTRGVPGTHDTALALSVISGLKSDQPVTIPRFNKATDNPFPSNEWPQVTSAPDVIIFEGWCVGVTAQDDELLESPINTLEANEDSEGIWRKYSNSALADAYQTLFSQLDYKIMLKAPSFDCVYRWRCEQEHKLAESGAEGAHIMSDEAILRFIQHYQRLTEHALQTLPDQCNTVFKLDHQRIISSEEVRE